MTKDKVLYRWFSRFMTAYPATAVPNEKENGGADVEFPYLTYDLTLDNWLGGEVGLTVQMWFHTSKEAEPNEAAEALSRAIGMGGVMLPCDGGYIWLKRGRPWCVAAVDQTNPSVKLRQINVTVEYLTQD